MGSGMSGNYSNTKGASNQSMPNHSKATTPTEKFVNYSLDYNNPNAVGKAEAYERALGYTKSNAQGLISQIHNAVTSGTSKPYQFSETEYGTNINTVFPSLDRMVKLKM